MLGYHDIITLETIMDTSHPMSFALQLKNEFERNTRRAEQGHIRMTQDTAPVYGPRKDFFISRACHLYNQVAAYNLPQK